MTNAFEIGCERHERERPTDMVEEIADCPLEDHMALMTENAAMRKQIADLIQTSFDLCPECGWRTLIPGEGCIKCDKTSAEKERNELREQVELLRDALGLWLNGDNLSTAVIASEEAMATTDPKS